MKTMYVCATKFETCSWFSSFAGETNPSDSSADQSWEEDSLKEKEKLIVALVSNVN